MIHLDDMVADRIDMLARFHATFGQDAWLHRTNDWTLIGLDAASFGGEADNGPRKGHTHQIEAHPADEIGGGWVPSIGVVAPDTGGGDRRLAGLARLTLDRDGYRFDHVEVPGLPGLRPADHVTAFVAPIRRVLADA